MPVPTTQTESSTQTDSQPKYAPLYHVVLLDDDDHTYDYVIEMLTKLFRHPAEQAYRLACAVDRDGRVIVETCMLELAELRRDQIQSFGADWRIPRCKGSMRAVVEPAG
jgi:ATP-dependent Clp protease adaptor protein ClpS